MLSGRCLLFYLLNKWWTKNTTTPTFHYWKWNGSNTFKGIPQNKNHWHDKSVHLIRCFAERYMTKVVCMACPLGWSQLFIFKEKIKMEPTKCNWGGGDLETQGDLHVLRNMQVLQNIPDTVWQMNSGQGTETMLPLSETGKSNSYASTNGIDETIFIFKEFYRRNFSTIIKGKIIHFSPAYLQSWNNNRSIAPFSI